MKKIISIYVLTAAMLSVFADKGWVVTQKYTGSGINGATITVTWYVTETQCKMKMQFSDAKVNSVNWFIPDLNNNQLLTYTEGAIPAGTQKAFFAVPVQDIKADKTMNTSRVTVQRTGETKTLAGLVCEKIIIKTNKSITEMWVTTDFKPDYYKFFPFFQNSLEIMGLSEEKIQGFPVSSVTRDNTGKIISSCQVVSASASQFSESDFSVPSEYKSAEELTKGKN